MNKEFGSGLVWFRRDLRVDDNAALFEALSRCRQVHCVFVFDTDILANLPRVDRRVEFIRESLVDLDASLRALNASAGLVVLHGSAVNTLVGLAAELKVEAVFASHDYEPHAVARDAEARGALSRANVSFVTVKDQVVFEKREVLTKTGTPYGVFTPYKNAWLLKAASTDMPRFDVHAHADALAARPLHYQKAVPALEDIGFLLQHI